MTTEEKEKCERCGADVSLTILDSVNSQFSAVHTLLHMELARAMEATGDGQKGPRKGRSGWSADKIVKLAQAQVHLLETFDRLPDSSYFDDDEDEINVPEAYAEVQDDIASCDRVLANLEDGPVREQIEKRRVELGFHEEMLEAELECRGEPSEGKLESCMKQPEEPSEEEAERLRKN